MGLQVSRAFRSGVATSLLLLVVACGGGSAPLPIGAQVEVAVRQSQQSVFAADAPVAGVTPFISFVTLRGSAVKSIASVNFVIASRRGAVSRPVSVSYSLDYLSRHGYASAGASALQVPVFGLYAGSDNGVTIKLVFNDGSSYALPLTIATAAWSDPKQIYDRPTIVQARAADSALGFDYLYVKSQSGSPVVIDSDAQVRWVGPSVVATTSIAYDNDGGFIMGSLSSGDIHRLSFDGSHAVSGSLASIGVSAFHHDIEVGKTGYLANVEQTISGVFQLESTLQEIGPDGSVIATWDMARIISDLMTAGGDDPTQFVRPGIDWFHMNTAVYDAADDSVIVSSRENFVVKLDYTTGAIRWIMGDTSKYWYTFPSLRAKALAWVGDGLVPIGQHSVTLANDGSLMLFNNGYASLNQPAGAPAGESRAYSAVSDYAIDEVAGTVREAWHFDNGQAISSLICSSARTTDDGSILVDYATAENMTASRLVGLDPAHAVVFDFRYANTGCNTAWNAQPLSLEALVLD